MIKGVCPDCRFEGDLVAFIVEPEAREATAEALKVPPSLSPLILRYLSMFRPAKRALSLAKAARLLRELAELVRAGQIEWKGFTGAAPLDYWRRGLETMLDDRDQGKLRLPLDGHNYLRAVVAGIAGSAAAAAEQHQETEHRRPHRPACAGAPAGANPIADVLKRIKPHDYVPAGTDTPSPLAGEGRGEG